MAFLAEETLGTCIKEACLLLKGAEEPQLVFESTTAVCEIHVFNGRQSAVVYYGGKCCVSGKSVSLSPWLNGSLLCGADCPPWSIVKEDQLP